MATKRIGLALGSGGAKGLAHIGVLKAMEELGIRVDMIAGSSMGSLIGAFYATGMTASFMERLALSLSRRHWLDLTVPKMGIIGGEKVHQMVSLLTKNLLLEQTKTPLAVVATDLLERRPHVFTTGPIADAVRASISIPGVFVPYATASGVYVDGGVIERVPVDAVRQLGADFVIAVDVVSSQRNAVPESVIDVIVQSLDIMQEYSYLRWTRDADIYIEPDVGQIGTSQFHRARESIAIGYEAAMNALANIDFHEPVRFSENSETS